MPMIGQEHPSRQPEAVLLPHPAQRRGPTFEISLAQASSVLRTFTVTKMYRSERNGRRSRDLPSTYALRAPNATPDTHGASGHKHG